MKFIFLHAGKYRSLLQGDTLIFGECNQPCLKYPKKFAYLCNIPIKAWGMELIFCLQINADIFYKMIVSLWVCIARQAQSTKNNQFAITF